MLFVDILLAFTLIKVKKVKVCSYIVCYPVGKIAESKTQILKLKLNIIK